MNADETAYELREFTCKDCGHKVVINPALPADYVPNICEECWQRGEPERRARQSALIGRFGDLLHKIGMEISNARSALNEPAHKK